MASYSISGGWYYWIVVFMSLSCMAAFAFGCLEVEKIALLKLKYVVNHQLQKESFGYYQSWTLSTDEEPDCCRWNSVTCDVFSKRIIKLSLGPFMICNYDVGVDYWILDASLFQPFQQLLNLTFRCGGLKGFDGPLRLPKLQVLDLQGNGISRVPLLGKLPSLKFLDLSYNAISQVRLMGELPYLKFLDLSYNEISHDFEVTNLNSLELLKLEYCFHGSEISPSIWTLTSLRVLGPSSNGLNGSFPEGLCALTNLEELDLTANDLEGVIPTCLGKLTSLRLLELTENQFSGTIPSNVLSSLESLEYLSLSDNIFDGFSFSSFANNSKLQVFELDSWRNPNLKVDTQNIQWKHPIFQLKTLVLRNCIVNIIPSFILSQYDLRIVDLSNNGMTGELPSWLITNNSRLEYLSLRNNTFSGRLTLQLDSFNAYLIYLDVSMNQIAGEIPTFIGSILPNLTHWKMSINAFEGSIPASIENMNGLLSLDISDNHLYGELPGGLFTGCETLRYLKLSNNKLGGNIFPKNMSMFSHLRYLYLDSNNFSVDLKYGRIETLCPSPCDMLALNITNNSISGRFPDWISELSNLEYLGMSKNHFEGTLPVSFCNLKYLTLLDLSWNNFSGTLPPCTNLITLRFLHLQGNKFHGVLPASLSRSSYMETLDVRYNNFSGFIPAWISSLTNLIILLLKGNHFDGSVPSELCQMKNLNILDLAANNLSGFVPPCLSHIPFGQKKKESDTFYMDMILYEDGQAELEFSMSYSYGNFLQINKHIYLSTYVNLQEDIQFMTKHMTGSYKGEILILLCGIDLSLNKLIGPIPLFTSKWDMVYSLNLSYNLFNGSIPWTLSRLKALESLDLSHNMLSGEIPSQITELNFLTVFSVAYNNLSGPTPTETRQFATFNTSSYEGNLFLYGCPLDLSCNGRSPPPQLAKPSTKPEQNDIPFETTFLWSFFGSFVVSCIGAVVFFYFNNNVPGILLGWIGVKRITPRTTVELPWMWNK